MNILRDLGYDNLEVSIVFVGTAKIRMLNKKYRDMNKVSSVLSFPALKDEKGRFKLSCSEIKGFNGYLPLGDIVLCPTNIKKEARIYRKEFRERLIFLVIHGLLHLLGFEHEGDASSSKRMERLERSIMKKLNFENPYLIG